MCINHRLNSVKQITNSEETARATSKSQSSSNRVDSVVLGSCSTRCVCVCVSGVYLPRMCRYHRYQQTTTVND